MISYLYIYFYLWGGALKGNNKMTRGEIDLMLMKQGGEKMIEGDFIIDASNSTLFKGVESYTIDFVV